MPKYSTPRPITREELDRIARAGCGDRDCRHHHDPQETVFLHPPCHTEAGLWPSYSVLRRTLLLECRQCQRPIAEIAVGEVWAGEVVIPT